MINTPHLLQMILIAVATVATAPIIGRLYLRHLKIEVFRYKCEFNFNQSVVYNDQLPAPVKSRLIIAYQENKKSWFRLLISRRPLKEKYWFTQEQIEAFFEPGNSGNPYLPVCNK